MKNLPLEYRAWDKEKKIMLYPSSIFDSGHHCSDKEGKIIQDTTAYITWNGLCYNNGFLMSYVFMQYTGLGDRHNKKIFVDDYLATSNEDTEYDVWSLEENGLGITSISTEHGVCINTVGVEEYGGWSWDDEESIYGLKFLKIVGNKHEGIFEEFKDTFSLKE